MYAVVGCSDCEALWVVETDIESTGCPRCGRRHQFDRLHQFVCADSIEVAREGRAAMLAARAGEAAAFERFRERADVASAVETPIIDDAEYLAAAGIDPETVAAAEAGPPGTDDRDRRSVIEDAIAASEPATETAILSYATDHGVEAETARSVLERLVEEGRVTEVDDTYRRV